MLGHFNAVGADILHRRTADRARNCRQIFNAVPTAFNCMPHEIIPYDAGRHLDEIESVVFVRHLDRAALHVQHKTFEVLGKERIRAASEHKTGKLSVARIGKHRANVLGRADFCEILRADINRKRVVGLKTDALFNGGHKTPSICYGSIFFCPIIGGQRDGTFANARP